jgi:hypothetical protein
MRGLAIGAALAACIAAAAAARGGGDVSAISFAVLRGDGILIPFATRAGDRWHNPWPKPARRVAVPTRLSDVPARWWGAGPPTTTWHAWLVDGQRTIATVQRPTWYPAPCRRGIGLQTDVTGRPPLPHASTWPYPKLGLATSAPVAFGRIESIAETHPLWMALLAALPARFTAGETSMFHQQAGEAFRRAFEEDEAGTPRGRPAHRQRGAVRLERLYRAPLDDDRFVHYFEARRRFAPSDGCASGTFASGWFVSDGATLPTQLPMQLTLVSCRDDGVRVMLPLGYVREPGATLWFAQLDESGRERYLVVRATSRQEKPDVAIDTAAGDCGDSDQPRVDVR